MTVDKMVEMLVVVKDEKKVDLMVVEKVVW
jgi:hypothetical protein